MKTDLIETTFRGTTINPKIIDEYANEDPGFLACVIEINGRSLKRKEANHADSFELYLRRYVVGKTRTMHEVNAQIRQFLAFDKQRAEIFIPILIERVEETILMNQWYELMPRFEQARHKIKHQFGIEGHLPPLPEVLPFDPDLWTY